MSGAVGGGVGEEVVVQTDLRVDGGVGVHPVDGGALDLAAVGGIAALGLRVVLRQDLDHVAGLVLHAAGAADEVGPLQAALRAGGSTGACTWGRGSPRSPRPRYRGGGRRRPRRVPAAGSMGLFSTCDGLAFPLGVVGDGQLNGTQHRHGPLGVSRSGPPAGSAPGSRTPPWRGSWRRRCGHRSSGWTRGYSPGGAGRTGWASGGRPSRRHSCSSTSLRSLRLDMTV